MALLESGQSFNQGMRITFHYDCLTLMFSGFQSLTLIEDNGGESASIVVKGSQHQSPYQWGLHASRSDAQKERIMRADISGDSPLPFTPQRN
jgi:hypothetical protein